MTLLSPFPIFEDWYQQQLLATKVAIPSACCLSTNGLDGYPNARFVSFKGFFENAFVITGTFSSRKGLEIELSNHVALTFWWAETQRQVRIQGTASAISEELATKYFFEREIEAQIVSAVSKQGKEIENLDILNEKYQKLEKALEAGISLEKPTDWSGIAIAPHRIELMEFKPTRFHERKCYELIDNKWIIKLLQP